MLPAGVIRPILLRVASVNQRLPSGPAAIPSGSLPDVGMAYSLTAPPTVTRPMLLPLHSVNHRLPSRPPTIPPGQLSGAGRGYSVILSVARAGTITVPSATAVATAPTMSRHNVRTYLLGGRVEL